MELPRVDPVGLSEVPEGYAATPRVHPPLQRLLALLVLGAFLLVGTATTVASLAAYCLTSQAHSAPARIPR